MAIFLKFNFCFYKKKYFFFFIFCCWRCGAPLGGIYPLYIRRGHFFVKDRHTPNHYIYHHNHHHHQQQQQHIFYPLSTPGSTGNDGKPLIPKSSAATFQFQKIISILQSARPKSLKLFLEKLIRLKCSEWWRHL